MIWYDMIWYDIWYDMLWYDIWYDMIWYDMILYDMIDMIWYDVMWCDVIWYVWSSQNCTIRRQVRFGKFETSRATIKQEMHDQVHAIFLFMFSKIVFCQTFKQFCVAFKVLILFFRIFFKLLNIALALNSKTTVSHFVFVFKFGACGYFHSNFCIELNNLKCTL